MDTNENVEAYEGEYVDSEETPDSFAAELGKSVAIAAATSLASVGVLIGAGWAVGKFESLKERRAAKKAEKDSEPTQSDNETK